MKLTTTRSIAAFVAALLLSITCSLALTATQTDAPMITASIQEEETPL